MLVGNPEAIVFTGGIGEYSHEIRGMVLRELGALKVYLDSASNDAHRGKVGVISTPDSAIKAIVMPTDEELMIAKTTQKLVTK